MMLSSCNKLITSTVGKYYFNHIHNEGTVTESEFYTEFPYEIKNNRIYLKVRQPETEKEYRFIFDTGGYSSISESIINDFEGEIMDYQFSTKDVNGYRVPQTAFRLNTISIGSLIIKDKNIVVTSYPTKDFDGIIGADLLKGKIFVFNPIKKIIIITNNKEVIKKDLFNSWKLKKRWDMKYLIKTNKNKFILDSGFDGFLSINEKSGKNEVLIEKKMKIAIEGASSVKSRKMVYLQLKNFSFKRICMDTANISVFSDFNENLLGSHILHKGITILDFINNKIYLKKNLKIKSIGNPPPIAGVYFGFFNGKVVVSQVDIKLENINIEPLDILLEINKIKINSKEYSNGSLQKIARLDVNHFVLERNGEKIEIDLTKKMLGL